MVRDEKSVFGMVFRIGCSNRRVEVIVSFSLPLSLFSSSLALSKVCLRRRSVGEVGDPYHGPPSPGHVHDVSASRRSKLAVTHPS